MKEFVRGEFDMDTKGAYIVLSIILGILLVFNLLLIVLSPIFIVFEIIVVICEYRTIKRLKKMKRDDKVRIEKENRLVNNGYQKICTNFFVNEEAKRINIADKEYGFSQIIDCELIENQETINNTYQKTTGKIKDNGHIKANTNSFSTQSNYCTELYINVTVDDFKQVNIKLNFRDNMPLMRNSKRYMKIIKEAEEAIAVLRLIISKNGEKYIENGAITKIEHKYITEEDASTKLQRLAELHKEGILTDYEFEMKKKEILEK